MKIFLNATGTKGEVSQGLKDFLQYIMDNDSETQERWFVWKRNGCEKMRTILFYGDSNTYGYDPADFYENRYPEEKRWTTILQRQLQDTWHVVEKGLNGRTIPDIHRDGPRIEALLGQITGNDLFAVMLGTNDILLTMQPDARIAIQHMEEFLIFLTERKPASEILLVAPVYIGDETIRDPLFQRYHEQSRRMNEGFFELSDRFGTLYLDAGAGGISLAADHVHFSEEGHQRFAEMMGHYLQKLPV